ncbi:MAG: hypothetical protein ABL958_22060, partial [Bdellovibrionia bacterium]
MKTNSKILQLLTIILTACLLTSYGSQARALDTDVEEVDEFEEAETPSADDPGALGDMEKLVLSDAATVEDAEAETKRAKIEAESAEKQLAEAQKRLNEMKLYKASLAQKTKQDVADAEKRKVMADKERKALDDSTVQELKHKADTAPTEGEARKALRTY